MGDLIGTNRVTQGVSELKQSNVESTLPVMLKKR